MIYFAIGLRDADGAIERLGMLEFASLEAAYSDVCAAIPDTAADLLRGRNDPSCYAYLISDDQGEMLMEVPFSGILHPWRTLRSAG